ncbi:putative ribonuclease H-like domain-containing protein [Tanacetum coccineum]
MNQLCGMKRIKREFSVSRTPQQNGVAERKNKTLIEAARTMLADLLLPTTFWAEAVNTACYVQNRVLVTKPHNKTPYELLHGRSPSISFMRHFECLMTILNTLDPLGKFDGKADEGFLVGYYVIDAVIDDTGKKTNEKPANEGERNGQEMEGGASNKEGDQNVQDFRAELDNLLVQPKEGHAASTNRDTADLLNTGIFSGAYDDEDEGAEADLNNLETTMNVSLIPTTRIHKDHPKDQIIGDINSATKTRRMAKISKEHALKVIQALDDPSWIEAMQEELLQFKLQKVWTLVDLPNGKRAIGTKWVFRNKKDERGIVVRNKERLVAQGYTQEEGIDYEEVFTLVARIEAIRLFLAYASFMGFIVYQIDVKSAFLYGTIEEEVYVCQPPGFKDPQFHDKVYKVEKALYGLHQAPRALQVYVDDIIFGSTKKSLCVDQDKYVANILKKFDFATVKTTSTLIETNKALLKDEEAEDVDVHLYRSMIRSLMYLTASRPDIMFAVCACARDLPFDLEAFSDSDYAGASLDRKSTTGDSYEKRLIQVIKIHTDHNVADLLTKAFDVSSISNEFGVKTGGCKVNAARQDLVLLGEKKSEGNADFDEIVDFLTASSVHYALTISPTIYASYIEQFWNTAHSQTVNDVKQIHATVDGKTVVISESSVRSDLHFNDEDGITCLTNDAIFENLALMGYESDSNKLTFQKALFSPQWKYLIHTILQCLSSKSTSWNEFSTNIASAVICLANGQKFNFSKLIFDEKGKYFSRRVTPLFASMLEPPVVEGEGLGQPSKPQPTPSTAQSRIKEQIPVTESSSPQNTQSPRQALQEDTQFPQTSVPIPNVADKAVFKEWDDRVVRATTTAASLDATQASGDRPMCQEVIGGVITQTRSEMASKHSYDSPLPGGNTSGSNEERIEQDDLIDFVPPTPHDSPLSGGHTPGSDNAEKEGQKIGKKLRARTPGMKLFKIGTSKRKSLDEEYVSKQGRKSDKTKPMFDDSDFAELDVDNAMDNVEGDAKTQGRNTAKQITTAGDIFKDEMMTIADTLVAIRSTRPRTTLVIIHDVEEEPRRSTPAPTAQPSSKDKGKALMVETKKLSKNLGKDQIQMDEELAIRLHKEEKAKLERMQRERAAQKEASNAALNVEFDNVQARIEADALLVARLQEKEREQFFIDEQAIFLVEIIAKRKRSYMKRSRRIKDFITMDSKEGGKKAASSEEQSAKKEKELSEEKLQKLLVVVPVEEVYDEAVQVKYPIIDWEVYSEDTRRYWKIIRVGNHREAYQIFADILKEFDRDDLVKLWDLVKKRFSITEPTYDKEKELWVELKRLFKPDNDDIIWNLQRYMHDPLV